MPFTHTEVRVNGATLFCMEAGSGDPLVLVHGSWIDHRSWQFVVPELAESFHVVAYDRRSHSRSRRAGDGPRSVHEDDLAALIEAFGLAPAHVAGSSYGASIALGLAAGRPELVRGVIAHEPPLLGNGVVNGNAELQPMLRAAQAQLQAVAHQVRVGDTRGGAARFIEEVTFGPACRRRRGTGGAVRRRRAGRRLRQRAARGRDRHPTPGSPGPRGGRGARHGGGGDAARRTTPWT